MGRMGTISGLPGLPGLPRLTRLTRFQEYRDFKIFNLNVHSFFLCEGSFIENIMSLTLVKQKKLFYAFAQNSFFLRRERDSNPRQRPKTLQRFSKPAPSATRPSLRFWESKDKELHFTSQIVFHLSTVNPIVDCQFEEHHHRVLQHLPREVLQ